MPAAKRIAIPDSFTAIMKDEHRTALKEMNDCTVSAMVTVTGLSYSVCHAALKAEGRKEGRGAYTPQYEAALASLGFRVTRWTSREMVDMVRSYTEVYGKSAQGITSHHPRRWPKCWKNKGPLLFKSRGHVAGVDANGIVNDWSINRSLRIIAVFSVERIA